MAKYQDQTSQVRQEGGPKAAEKIGCGTDNDQEQTQV